MGASQGIGVNLAERLYEKNCSTILVARTESKLQHQIQNIKEKYPESSAKISYAVADVSNYDECTRLWRTIDPADPDILFCCAGSSIPKLFQDLTKVDIELGIDINYKTVINVVHTGFKHALSNNTDNLEPHNFKREASYCSAQSSAFSPL